MIVFSAVNLLCLQDIVSFNQVHFLTEFYFTSILQAI